MTGIKDVAREVGVSTATVSRALRGLPRVSPETRERVFEVATRMGYVASPHAASLAGGQTHAIGVVVPNVTRWFFGSVVHGAEELLRQEGYDLLLYTVTGEPAARQRLFHSHLLSKRVDAVMVLALRPTPEEVASLERTDSPTVVVGGAVPGWSSVRIDDVLAAETAVRHLVGLGHTRIAHLGGVPDPEHAGLDFSTPGDGVRRLSEGDAGGRSARRARLGGHRRLHRARRPDGVPPPAGERDPPDGDLRGVRRDGDRRPARRTRGRPAASPTTSPIIGIDNHELSEYFDLSTIAQPAPELGRLGARMLLDALRVRHPGPAASRRSCPTQLIARGTTARLG